MKRHHRPSSNKLPAEHSINRRIFWNAGQKLDAKRLSQAINLAPLVLTIC
jgi:hypothetical protein